MNLIPDPSTVGEWIILGLLFGILIVPILTIIESLVFYLFFKVRIPKKRILFSVFLANITSYSLVWASAAFLDSNFEMSNYGPTALFFSVFFFGILPILVETLILFYSHAGIVPLVVSYKKFVLVVLFANFVSKIPDSLREALALVFRFIPFTPLLLLPLFIIVSIILLRKHKIDKNRIIVAVLLIIYFFFYGINL